MSVASRVAKNTVFLFSSQMIIQMLSVLLAIVIARKLGEVEFGAYAFATAFAAIMVMVFAEMGYQTLLIREVAKNKGDATTYLNNILGVRILLTVIALVMIIITINLMGYGERTKLIVYIFSASTLISSLSGVFLVTFRSFQRMEYEAIASIIEGGVKVGLGLVVLFLNMGLVELGMAFVLASVIGFVVSSQICKKKFVSPKIQLNISFLRSTLSAAVYLAILPMLAIMYIRADTIILSLLKGEAVVGWYNAAYNIVLTLKMVPILLMTSLFPAAVSISVSSKDLFHLYYEKAIKNLIALGIPITISLAVLSEQVISFVYGSNFLNSIDVLRILALDCLLMFMYQPLANALIGMGKERQVAVSAGLCLGLNVLLNVWLIPIYGMVGAAVVTVVSEVVLLTSNLRFYNNSIGHLPLLKFFAKPVLSSIPMILIVLLLDMSLIILVPIGIVAYFLTYFIIGGLDVQEVQMLRHVITILKGKIYRTKTKV